MKSYFLISKWLSCCLIFNALGNVVFADDLSERLTAIVGKKISGENVTASVYSDYSGFCGDGPGYVARVNLKTSCARMNHDLSISVSSCDREIEVFYINTSDLTSESPERYLKTAKQCVLN